jgi:hypothetical protein
MSRTITYKLLLLSCLTFAACLGNGFGVVDGFDAVDTDYDRPSPQTTTEGALTRSCETESVTTAPKPLEHALCLCGDLQDVGQGLVTRSFSHAKGDDGGLAHVGINGGVEVVGNFNVGGTLDVAGGVQGVGRLRVGQDLVSGDDVEITGSWTVGRDAWIDSDLSGVGNLDIGRDLYLSGDLEAIGKVKYGQGHRGFRYRGLPCGCGPEQIIDVAAEVAARRDSNDNTKIPGGTGATRIVLEDGEFYYADAAPLVGARSIEIRGRVALYVDSDIETVGNLSIELAQGAELRLWVRGKIETVGNLNFTAGDERPRAFQLFMGGRGAAVMNVGNSTFIGSIYAPEVDIEYVGSLNVRGSLFANNLRGTGNLTIDYDTDIVAPDACADEHYQTVE